MTEKVRLHIPRLLSWRSLFALVAVLGLTTLAISSARVPRNSRRVQANANSTLKNHKSKLVANYGKLPLSFDANRGQTDGRVKFTSRGNGYALYLGGSDAVLALRLGSQKLMATGRQGENSTPTPKPAVLKMKLAGANPNPRVRGLDRLAGYSNYFYGNDPRKWRTHVPNYAKVKYDEVYPGVDLVYYGHEQQLEFDFLVAPGANPHAISMVVEGADDASTDDADDLVLGLEMGKKVVLGKPVVFQEVHGTRREIDGRFLVKTREGKQDSPRHPPTFQIAFQLGSYDHSLPLVIDPPLNYATYLGGSSFDATLAIAADTSGNAYVAGLTGSSDYPVTNGGSAPGGGGDVIVTKLNPTGTQRVFSIYLGGNATEEAYGIALDAGNNIFLTGDTYSTDFPGATGGDAANGDAFVTKLDSTGTLAYTTLLHGSAAEVGQAIQVDSSGNTYVIGSTNSSDFPIVNGFQTTCGSCSGTTGPYDAFIAKVKFDGSAVLYSSFLGGSGADQGKGIAIDGSGKMYVIGTTSSNDFPTHNSTSSFGGGLSDAFVAAIDPAQTGPASLQISTYIGDNSEDVGNAIAIDNSGHIYIAGFSDFPTTLAIGAPGLHTANAGMHDAFVAKINISDSTYVYATFLGGSNEDFVSGIAVDSSGNAYVTGSTSSSDFPMVNAVDSTFNTSGQEDTYVAELSPDGMTLLFSTYLGGEGGDVAQAIAVNGAGQIFVTGTTTSTDFPASTGVVQPACGDTSGCNDGFVASYGLPSVNGPQATPTPASLAFGNVTVNQTASETVVLKNTGTATLNISSIAVTGTDAANFTLNATATTCTNSTALAVDGTCNLTVDFKPTAAAGYSASLDVGSNATNAPTHVPLSGTGVPAHPAISVDPTSLDFGTALVGTAVTYSVTVTNTGTTDLTLSAITVGGTNASNFAVASSGTTCATSTHIAPNGTCTISVTFTAPATDTRQATLTITSDATNTPTLNIGMVARGSDFSFGTQSGGSTSATTTAGGTATYNLAVTGTTGVTGNAALTCTGAPAASTCTVNPTTITLSDTAPATFTVSVTTTARGMSTPRRFVSPLSPNWPLPLLPPAQMTWLLALALVLGMVAISRRRARGALGVAMLAMLLWTACGGSAKKAPTGTPAGTYTLTLTAQIAGVTKTQALTLTVN